MDEQKGRAAAISRNLVTAGTIGVLERAVRAGLADGRTVTEALRRTSFRVRPQLLIALERASRI